MQRPGYREEVVRFSDFELNLRTGMLERNGERLSLQERPFQVLAALLERPGELVTRGELRERLWGSDTFVEFEDSLNHAVQKVREVLGDSAKSPRFVKTIPRRGYCFIAPVEEVFPKTVSVPSRIAALALLLVAVVGAVWWFSSGSTEAVSLAVLPLDNLSADPEQEYFADGLTEAVITELAKIGSLRVISRQSVMQFKQSARPLPEIAEDLGVETLVEGSVSKEQERIRITVQLIATSPERHLWAETYDRPMTDIFAIQQEVAEKIAMALELSLSEEEKDLLAEEPTQNIQAYNLVLAGDHFSSRDTIWDLKKAVDHYHEALELDPNYAEALAKSAEASHRLAGYARENREEWGQRAEEEALRSIELDDRNAFAHLAWALIQWRRHGDMDSVEASYRRALALGPRIAETHRSYGGFLCGRGRLDEALIELRKAHELDPLGYRMNEHLVRLYLVRGEFDKALEHSHRIFDYHPASFYGPMWLAATYLHLGEYEQVKPWLEKVFPTAPEWYHLPPILLAWSYLYQGQIEEAGEIVDGVLSESPRDKWGNQFAAELALWTGDYERAMKHYQQVQSAPLFAFIWRAPGAHHQARLGYVLTKLGEQSEAENLFSRAERVCREKIGEGDQRYGLLEVMAMIHAIRGNREEALKWLERAIEAGWSWYDAALQDPVWADLHDEPRFQQLMTRVEAKVDRMRSRTAEMEREWE